MTCWRRLRDWNEAGVWKKLAAERDVGPGCEVSPARVRLLLHQLAAGLSPSPARRGCPGRFQPQRHLEVAVGPPPPAAAGRFPLGCYCLGRNTA
jgi:hypothetical protein